MSRRSKFIFHFSSSNEADLRGLNHLKCPFTVTPMLRPKISRSREAAPHGFEGDGKALRRIVLQKKGVEVFLGDDGTGAQGIGRLYLPSASKLWDQ